VWWLIASEIVIFGGVLGSYVMHRSATPSGRTTRCTPNVYAGALQHVRAADLLSLSAVLAHQAAELGDGKKAAQLPADDRRRRA
jgi:heme/copper-type cytochrome/quinol oxidase subunit 3